PAFVFNVSEKGVAEAASHEVGHALGLLHDGTSSQEYYGGHGSGATSWAPIMGVGYSRNLVQWSRGEYPDADNTEDDLDIIVTQNGFTYRSDDHGDSTGAATYLGHLTPDTDIAGDGIIERNTDVDYFQFSVEAGTVQLSIEPFYRSPNLDIEATLYDSSGNVLATSNPTDALDATLSQYLTSGVYYVSVDGVGRAATAGDPGYSDYGSLGYYSISGALVPGPTLVQIEVNETADASPDLLWDGDVLTDAPRELTFVFNPGETIAPGPGTDINEAAFQSIRIVRAGGDGDFDFAEGATDFGTNGTVVVDAEAKKAGVTGNGVTLVFQAADLGPWSADPAISVVGDTITVTLNTNASKPTKSQDLVAAVNNDPDAAKLVTLALRHDNLSDPNTFPTSIVSGTTMVLTGANVASNQTDFNTNGAVEVRFSARQAGPDGNGIVVDIQLADRGGTGPLVTVDQAQRRVVLTLDTNATNPTTAQQAVNAINSDIQARQIIEATLVYGDPAAAVATTAQAETLTLDGASDVELVPGYVEVKADAPNEVLFRFADSLPDDDYLITIVGDGTNPSDPLNTLQNISGAAFNAGIDQHIQFEIDLPPQVVAVVPQPIERVGNTLQQRKDQIVVYFNDDDLDPATATMPRFYQLIDTRGTVQTDDDTILLPQSVTYDSVEDKAVLTFANALPDSTFRLRIGRSSERDSNDTVVKTLGTLFDTPDDFVASGYIGDDATFGAENDVDLYPFDLPADSVSLDVTVSPQPGLDTALRLFDQNGNVVTGNEIQELSFVGVPTTGTFKLELDGQQTAALPFTATAQQVRDALAALSNLGANEVQSLQIQGNPTGGTFRLAFNGQETADLSWDADAAAVDAALEALPTIGLGNVVVTGGPLPNSPLTIEFVGSLVDTNVSEITVARNDLTGGTNPQVVVATTTEGRDDLLVSGGALPGESILIA
ncbi:MAG: hypothetical protein GXP27_06585, partial [Planctomycetes bacterium]|nr:hypothetical protein [Planctomycetota bacterium]